MEPGRSLVRRSDMRALLRLVALLVLTGGAGWPNYMYGHDINNHDSSSDDHLGRHDDGEHGDEKAEAEVLHEPLRPHLELGVEAAADDGGVGVDALELHA